ncbi:MAG: HAD family hydrolase [Candidatus Aenigmarchaeota archaeon]|nr:HAD family hydrolase [Candidatus Aenigmarchaeota archaeon]
MIIAFDIMGVLFPESHMVRNGLMKVLPNHDYSAVKHFYNLYTIGQISRKEFWSKLNVRNFKEIEEKFLDLFSIDKDIFNVLEYLKQKYKLGIITNHTTEWFEYLDKKFGFKKFFSIIIISSEIKERKPNSRIFRIFLEKANISGNEVYFIDDKLENLKFASQLGIKTIWLKRGGQKNDFEPNFIITKLSQLKEIL